jgi:hypothetical protein
VGYRVEVGPIIAQAVRRRSRQAVGLPALAALLLASFSIAFSIAFSTAFSTAVAALGPGLPGGGHPVLVVATSGPVTTPVRTDGHGSGDLDVLSGYLQATPAAESAGVFAITLIISRPPEQGTGRDHQGRAPPHAR